MATLCSTHSHNPPIHTHTHTHTHTNTPPLYFPPPYTQLLHHCQEHPLPPYPDPTVFNNLSLHTFPPKVYTCTYPTPHSQSLTPHIPPKIHVHTHPPILNLSLHTFPPKVHVHTPPPTVSISHSTHFPLRYIPHPTQSQSLTPHISP